MKLQSSSYQTIRWAKKESFDVKALAEGLEHAAVALDPLQLAVHEFGEPMVEGTPAEEAMVLLEAAAEIEQQLMVQYLYSYFSLRPEAPPLWKKLKTVFKEEMGHLLTVQNLLLLAKNTPHLARMSGVAEPDQPFPLRLEPFGTSSLAKYVAAESPDPKMTPLPQDLQMQAAPAFAEATRLGSREIG